MIKKEIENRQLITATNPINPTWNSAWNSAWWENWTIPNANDDWTIPNANQVPTQCPQYNKNSFSSNWSLNNWSYDLTKTAKTTDWHWTIKYKRNITCNAPNYTENGDIIVNTTCDTWYSPSADWMNCVINTLSLFASAEYDTVWDIDLKDSEWHKYWETDSVAILNNYTSLPSICESEWSEKSKSFCKLSDDNWWIFVDKPWNDDFIKYTFPSDEELSWDFKIEMRVHVPDEDKHYLFHSWNFKLFTEGEELKFQNVNYTSDKSNPAVTIWAFNKIYIKRVGSSIYIATGDIPVFKKAKKDNWNYDDIELTFAGSIDHLYVWAWNLWDKYYKQINDIIDYVKIYK